MESLGDFRESKYSEKQRKLERALQEVEKLVDKVGIPIDEGIKETVAILQVMGFQTSSSCSGHRSSEEGIAPPYIEIYAPAPSGWEKNKQKQEEWEITNNKQRERINALLEEFNRTSQAITEAQLYLRNIGGYGGFRIQSKNAEKPPATVDEKFKIIEAFQKEMAAFTAFIKERYFRE